MNRRFLGCMIVLGVLAINGALPSPVEACPMCKFALETSNALPRAYMMSILFMLGMPATVLAGFGVGFYRLSRKQNLEDGLETATDPDSAATEPAGEEDLLPSPR